MSDIIRFGVSLEKKLLEKFDKLIKEKKYSNRSEAIRDLIRDKLIIYNQQINIDHDNCLEIIVVRGKPKEVRELADKLRATKGVKYGSLSIATTGKELV